MQCAVCAECAVRRSHRAECARQFRQAEAAQSLIRSFGVRGSLRRAGGRCDAGIPVGHLQTRVRPSPSGSPVTPVTPVTPAIFLPPFPFSESPVRACLLGKLPTLLPPAALLPAVLLCSCPTLLLLLLLPDHHPPPSTAFYYFLLTTSLTLSSLSLSLSLSLPAGVLILGRVSTTPPLQQPRSTSCCPLGSSCSLSCRAVYTSRTSSRMPFRTRDEQLAARYFLFPPPPPCSCCALLLSFLLHITCTRSAFEMI